MNYIRINNLQPNNQTRVDYKGLDIDQFVAGSQVYDFDNGVCLVKTRETDIPEHEDLQVLTEEEYETIKDVINSNSPAEKEKSEIEQLNSRLEATEQALVQIMMEGMI